MNNSARQTALKPIDVVVALELATRIKRPTAQLAKAVGISVGEAHNSVNRLILSGLVERSSQRVVVARLDAFLEHGVAIAFPATWWPATLGVETARTAPSPSAEDASRTVVWPHGGGTVRGRGLIPLFPAAVTLPSRNPALYRLLALVDVLRVEGVRDRSRALQQLRWALAGLATDPAAEGAEGAEVPLSAAGEMPLAHAASLLEPLLTRVVFTGRAAAEVLRTSSAVLAPPRRPEDAELRLLTSYSIDRLGNELRALGLERTNRGERKDQWRAPDGLTFNVEQVTGDEDQPGMPWLEYALLLTHGFDAGAGRSIRVSAAPSLLALLLHEHEQSAKPVTESASVEDVVALVALRAGIARECAAIPAEIRQFIERRMAELLADAGLAFVVERVLPDAVVAPDLVTSVIERVRELARLA